MDISLMIEELLPAAQYGGSLTDNSQASFDALRWEDKRPKPAWDEIENAWTAYSPPRQFSLEERIATLETRIKGIAKP